ncbi:MAG: enoyl-CoA hydratase/isomerase family protein [Lachnospiraceae bacterium]|nr:enoyl-CoA hydratase/isomerase family protein [Lachnospiraceae bacterium]
MGENDRKYIQVEINDKIGYVTLDRAPANAFVPEMYMELAHAMYELGEEKGVAVVVLRANGRMFCAGNDTSDFSSFDNIDLAADNMYYPIQAFSSIWNNKKPVIAAVNGACMGIGFAMALVSDFIIASENAKFGMPEVKLGIPAAACFLQASLPLHVAKRLAFTGDFVTASELERWGVVMKVTSADALWSAADELAHKLAASCYRAVSVLKQNYHRNYDPHFADKFRVEQQSFFDHMLFSHDFKEAIAAYNEKRKPEFTGE